MLHASLLVGTRPQIIKSAPIIQAATSHHELKLSILHTGQHYDYEMSRIFFSELNLPKPVKNLNVGSASDLAQISHTMLRLEEALPEVNPDIVLVPGDTNSALAAALAANKMHIPVAHVEAGARSHELSLPEEVNRRLIDHLSTLLFAPTSTCIRNLRSEGIHGQGVRLTGDTLLDLFLRYREKILANELPEKLGLGDGNFVLLTIHREATVESKTALMSVVNAILRLGKVKIVFPIHPHTRAKLAEFELLGRLEAADNVKVLEPVGYLESMALAKRARLVVCDSGGLQKEAFWLGTPCVTLREKTEWIETIKRRGNVLAGPTREEKIVHEIRKAISRPNKVRVNPNPFGDGHASERIISELIRLQDHVPSDISRP